jgi:hypothetical protein
VLQNASNPNVDFKYSVDDIIWNVRTAYATGMYQLYADCLHIENNRGGDIATGNQAPDQIEEIRLELTKQLTKKFFVRNVVPNFDNTLRVRVSIFCLIFARSKNIFFIVRKSIPILISVFCCRVHGT